MNAEPLDTGAALVADAAGRVRPDAAVPRPAVLAVAPGGERAERARRFGRSRARRYEPSGDRVTFADVAGIEEAKDELSEVVDFLRHPEKYGRLGGRIPHGVLLSGPPGTGKTLLARAVAGEADAPFFSMAASEFVEAIVGVGAARVRDLFIAGQDSRRPRSCSSTSSTRSAARAPSGIAGYSGGNDEREQTLNQILTEMDGFDSSTGVIVIAATNRPEVLDQALLRPGRFDRRVAVQPPDRAGREAILEVHTRGVPLGPDVDLGRIAATTPGMVGADLANLVNEAALLAARREPRAGRGGRLHRRARADRARRRAAGDDERRRTAAAPPTTRAGTRWSACSPPGADPVRKISIIPRGMALGVTFSAPDARSLQLPAAASCSAKIKVALGGRVAEEVVFGEITHRRRVRHPAADRDRPPDGRPLGHERGDRAARGDPARRQRAAAPRRGRGVASRRSS